MASSIAEITMLRSIDFSRATASAICSSSSLLALTAMAQSPLSGFGLAPARPFGGEAMLFGVLRRRLLRRAGFMGVRRRRRFEAEAAFQFALGLLAAPHRFRDQF